jgi:uncharacterized protein
MMYYLSGFLVGIMGSLHCLGMCAPLSMVMGNRKFLIGKLVYNSGRVITYAILGLFVGLLGQLIAYGGLQQVLSIFAGVFILAFAALPYLAKRLESGNTLPGKLVFWLKKKMGLFIKKPGYSSSFTVGMLNGILPCGLVYLALAGAALAGSMEGGMIYMIFFGLGTFPMMLLAASIGKFFQKKFSLNLVKVYPYFMAALGIIFIIRGLDLGIPMVSPSLLMGADSSITDC